MTTAREFAILPPRKSSEVFLALIFGVPALAVLLAVAVQSGVPLLAWVAVDAGVFAYLLAGFGLGRALRRMRACIDDRVLELRAPLQRLRVAVGMLDLAQARIVDLNREPSLRPRLKSGGVDLPGVAAGHFRGRPFSQRLFCLLTRRERVLLLPERSGRRLLLSLERPQALLDALRGDGMADTRARR